MLDMKELNGDNQTFQEFHDDWKGALVSLLDTTYVWIDKPPYETTAYVCEFEPHSPEDFLNKINPTVFKMIKERIANDDGIKSLAEMILVPLESEGLVETVMGFRNLEMYRLTQKGVDIALKLQEHNDAEKRFVIQTSMNQQVVDNSAIAKHVSFAALGCASILAVCSALRLLKELCIL